MQERLYYLFGQYLNNNCSRKELDELFSYISQADNDQQLRQLIRNTYNSIQKDFSSITAVDENGQLILNNPPSSQQPDSYVKRDKFRSWMAIAASVIVIAGCSIWFSLKNNIAATGKNKISAITKKTTDRSESKFILLEDSTRVWLNAASSLEFPEEFNKKKREVFLSGEAYFEVKHADRVPFIIHTGSVATTVLGTSFNIKAYPGQKNIIVSVSSGKVKVTRKDILITTLVRGQQAKIDDRGPGIIEKIIPPVDIAAWQHGNIVFDDEAFEDIIADMERVYNTSINISDDSIRRLNISTSFKKEIGVEQALQVLCKLTDTELRIENGIYIIK